MRSPQRASRSPWHPSRRDTTLALTAVALLSGPAPRAFAGDPVSTDFTETFDGAGPFDGFHAPGWVRGGQGSGTFAGGAYVLSPGGSSWQDASLAHSLNIPAGQDFDVAFDYEWSGAGCHFNDLALDGDSGVRAAMSFGSSHCGTCIEHRRLYRFTPGFASDNDYSVGCSGRTTFHVRRTGDVVTYVSAGTTSTSTYAGPVTRLAVTTQFFSCCGSANTGRRRATPAAGCAPARRISSVRSR